MNYRVVNTLVLAQTIEARQDKLHALPAKGTHVGGGVHVPMPDAWDGNGAVPPGWSSYKGSRIEHPAGSQWAVPIDHETPAALANGRAARLTAPEQAGLAADVAASELLTSDWFPDGVQGLGAINGQGAGKR